MILLWPSEFTTASCAARLIIARRESCAEKIWVAGRDEPVTLDLTGNAWPDLAGCLLKFTNPLKPIAHPHIESLNPVQKGTIGDLTASRKVRVFDIPTEEAYLMSERGEKPPEHMANCLYLEWFSQYNGRVVIESTDYQLEISTPLSEQLTPEEGRKQRARDAAAGMAGFMQKLSDAIETQKRGHDERSRGGNGTNTITRSS